MDKRQEPRFDIDQPVVVTKLDRPSLTLAGRITNFSANGTCLVLEMELPRGAMVKVQWGTTILLGEIIHCSPLGREFAVGLKLEDALYGEEMIASLSRNWYAETAASRR